MTAPDDRIPDLDWSAIPLFRGMSLNALDRIRPLFRPMSLEAGQELITEGEEGDEMYILIQGRVRVSKSMLVRDMQLPILDVENPRKVLATLEGEEFPVFGEIALIDRDTRSATVAVVRDSDFLVTDRQAFFEFVEREPSLGARLLLVLARRMAGTIRKSNSEMIKLSTALALALSRVREHG